MGVIMRDGIRYGNSDSIELTKAEYDALVENNEIEPDVNYFVTDEESEVSVTEVILTTDENKTIRFGQDEEGNWGYIPDGADTVIPFKSGGGEGQYVEGCVEGNFVSADSQYGKVTVDLGFKPDFVCVTLPFDNGNTHAIYMNSNGYEQSYWDLRPVESPVYWIELGSSTGETGICEINNNGFVFRSNAANTRNKKCKYIAYHIMEKSKGVSLINFSPTYNEGAMSYVYDYSRNIISTYNLEYLKYTTKEIMNSNLPAGCKVRFLASADLETLIKSRFGNRFIGDDGCTKLYEHLWTLIESKYPIPEGYSKNNCVIMGNTSSSFGIYLMNDETYYSTAYDNTSYFVNKQSGKVVKWIVVNDNGGINVGWQDLLINRYNNVVYYYTISYTVITVGKEAPIYCTPNASGTIFVNENPNAKFPDYKLLFGARMDLTNANKITLTYDSESYFNNEMPIEIGVLKDDFFTDMPSKTADVVKYIQDDCVVGVSKTLELDVTDLNGDYNVGINTSGSNCILKKFKIDVPNDGNTRWDLAGVLFSGGQKSEDIYLKEGEMLYYVSHYSNTVGSFKAVYFPSSSVIGRSVINDVSKATMFGYGVYSMSQIPNIEKIDGDSYHIRIYGTGDITFYKVSSDILLSATVDQVPTLTELVNDLQGGN